MKEYFMDLHIHIGQDIEGQPVKISASKNLTLTNILEETSQRKGIELIGIIDCHAPNVQKEIDQLLKSGLAEELKLGGIKYENTTLILGTEIEVNDENCLGPVHVLSYFPHLYQMKDFTQWLSQRMKNISLSSQRYYGTMTELQDKVKSLEGLFIPAHVFTPFKSAYGKGVKKSLSEIFNMSQIDAIELGLSADSMMADQINELHQFTFLSNSDAHSLAKIGREYQKVLLEAANFEELRMALTLQAGRKIVENYGMNPKLGKYHSTVCKKCGHHNEYKAKVCTHCHAKQIVNGVADRIDELSILDHGKTEQAPRPNYVYQVPLEYLPGIGKKTIQKLLVNFGTEMTVIHHTSLEQLQTILADKQAKAILNMRQGLQNVKAGGGGKYGQIVL